MEHFAAILDALASAFVAGESTVDAIVERCAETLGRRWRWLRPLARRYVALAGRNRSRHRDVRHFLSEDRGVLRAYSLYAGELNVVRRLVATPRTLGEWNLPAIVTPGDLADWLALTPGELDWFADLKALGYKRASPKLQHYRYRVIEKGGGAMRLIEAPKPRLKWIQQRILAGILEKIPPHPAAHGFVKGRSVKTFAAPHVGRNVVLRMDLRDFFPSISGARIQTVFHTLGYPENVADILGGIATNATPRNVLRDPLYSRPHLPQGAPTSPALANFCLYRADCRLFGLAESAGARYTRYADDLAFSGGEDFDRPVERFAAHAAAILSEEGFAVHHRKTRIMRPGVRQHLAGVVANRKLNVWRADYDCLKAILTNCVRHGAASQNRDGHNDFRAHLEGRVSYVASLNPEKGKKLRVILERIVWK
ncbi:MAG TPA: reverse transcriptase family protein [Bryobacteraceae bacterium]|nr:reverse transcriptase family protein [Bryobacteraceae bacterium]